MRLSDLRIPPLLSSNLIVRALALCGLITLYTTDVPAEPFVPWQSANAPLSSQASALTPQRVRPKLSFQTRLSQATLPILEGLLYRVKVKYKDLLDEGDCEEEFRAVKVQDSVLNLELGLNAGCDFASAIAQRSSLSFELCFTLDVRAPAGSAESSVEGEERCFNHEVEVGSAPYALNVSHAVEAESVYEANTALISSYAHKLAAQSAPLARYEQPPHFSVHTRPPQGLGLSALRLDPERPETLTPYQEAGYVKWHPLVTTGASDPNAYALYIAQGSPFAYLNQLILGAHTTDWYGPRPPVTPSTTRTPLAEGGSQSGLSVRGRLEVEGDLEVSAGRVVVDQATVVSQGARVERGGVITLGQARLNGAVSASRTLNQGWRSPTLSSAGVPSYSVQVGGALHFVGPLSLLPLTQVTGLPSAREDQSSLLNVADRVELHGGARVDARRGAPSQVEPEVKVTGDANINAHALVSAGALDIVHDLNVQGDLAVRRTLELGDSISLLREGATQEVVKLSGDTLAFNHDPDQPEGAPVYDEVRFKGRVLFANRVTFDPGQPGVSVPSECSIVPARDSRGKLIPQVIDLTCHGVTVRVSALLESICGNGQREGGEVCDLGDGNSSIPVDNYCNPTSTPFPNCQFYRHISGLTECPLEPLTVSGVTFTCVPFTTLEGVSGVALQSAQDEEDLSLNADISGTSYALNVTYPQLYCRQDCTHARCGDGVHDEENKELCDDGNFVDNDDCDNSCRLVTSCKLDVKRRVNQRSDLVQVTTTPKQGSAPDDPLFYSVAECAQGDSVVTHPAPQQVVELDLEEPTWVAFETYPYTQTDPDLSPHPDTFLHRRVSCDDVRSASCDDDGGVGYFSALPPQQLDAGRHYVVVGGFGQAEGTTNLAVKLTCAEPQKLIGSLYYPAEESTVRELVIQADTSVEGGVGYVEPLCVTALPEGFIQPKDPNFNIAEAQTGYGLHQVAIEVILESTTRLTVTADSLSLDPVIYLRSGCESAETLSVAGDAADLLCNDNATGNALQPLARVDRELPAGVYYVIVDNDSLTGGEVNISLRLSHSAP